MRFPPWPALLSPQPACVRALCLFASLWLCVGAFASELAGNRTARASTLAGLPAVASMGVSGARDRLSGDGYDANGNTLSTGAGTGSASAGAADTYDWADRLSRRDTAAGLRVEMA